PTAASLAATWPGISLRWGSTTPPSTTSTPCARRCSPADAPPGTGARPRRPCAAWPLAYARPVAPIVYLITGPMAAGKSTVARLLASRFPRGVHLEGDLFRRSIVTGREEVTPALRPEAMEQLRLRYRLVAAAADTYAEAGFTVALEDVVAGPLLGDYRTMIRSRPCHVVVLLPSADALAARAHRRRGEGRPH